VPRKQCTIINETQYYFVEAALARGIKNAPIIPP
jgi:hypothetical protein